MIIKTCHCGALYSYPKTDYHSQCSGCSLKTRMGNYADPDGRINGSDNNVRWMVKMFQWRSLLASLSRLGY